MKQPYYIRRANSDQAGNARSSTWYLFQVRGMAPAWRWRCSTGTKEGLPVPQERLQNQVICKVAVETAPTLQTSCGHGEACQLPTKWRQALRGKKL
ncbi:MAG: hypothetical protein D6736_00815 [Nitrospinota bacterium]|nr:MAG: hypothetical protein D6736_00815 [Nitrospinota bacterium]